MNDEQGCPGTNRDGDPCGHPEAWGVDGKDSGPCKHHGGAGGAPEENQNARTHGAFSKHFTSDLTQAEEDAFEDARERLGDPESAQEVAREVAAELLLKYKRSGDERFITRFENVCDKFGLVPEDELNVNHSGLEGALMADLKDTYDE